MKKFYASIAVLFCALSVFSQTVDLSTYVRVGRYDLPEPTRTAHPANSLLAQEASAVTYNWDTQTLFVVGDGGTSVVQVSKTGALINSMTLAPGGSPQGTDFYDPEGLTYIGNNQFVFSEERDRQAVLFTYVAGGILTRADAKTVKLGTFVQNIGIEGISFDPFTGGFICAKEKDPIGIFQTGIDFANGTATNGSPTTENSVNLFDPALLGVIDIADVFALSNLPTLNGQPNFGNLLVLSQESAKILNVDRTGHILSSLTIVSDPGNPLDVVAQQHEGITMDRNGNIYTVSENGGGDFDHPQLWVYAPATVANQAPTAVALANVVTSIAENTSTVSPIKVADIIITDDGQGNNKLYLSGPDTAFLQITGSSLFIKAGTVLDFETKTSYAVTVNVDDTTIGTTPDASVNYLLAVADVVVETPPVATITISEVAPWSSGNSPVAADWFEVTNNGTSAVNITGWKMDDNSNSFASSVALNGITSIGPGESVIFLETASPATTTTAFINTWFGGTAPAGLQIGSYTGSGVGLSTGGDAVNLFDAAGTLQAKVTFNASPAGPFPTFNNAAGLNNQTISELSKVGVNGAFKAMADTNEIGSPGTIGRIIISEVAPWSSGNSPVAADWFEVTNTKATAVDITGWKIDDNSGSFAASVPLAGITSIAPGESVIFLETASPSTTNATFINTWFGGNASAAPRLGSYTGSGVGLSTSGDAVNLYNGAGQLQASVIFGAASSSAPFKTFDNAAGLNNVTISQLSATGLNGAFVAANDANEIGSPGRIAGPVCTGAVPAQPGDFTKKSTFVYYGDAGLVYTVPPISGVTFKWSYSGTGATIHGTGNSVIIDYSSSATNGVLSVSDSTACGTSQARTLPIYVNSPIVFNTVNHDYSFVTVGCNRVDYLDTAFSTNDIDFSTGASTANVYQLKRLFTEIAHLNPLPRYLILTGDIVMGYKTPSTPDTAELAKQLTAWRAIYESHPLSSMGIQLITIPGNHETQDKAAGKKSFLAAEQIFTRVMAPYIRGNNGPGIGGPDSLTTDQSKLTYSFDDNGDHYIILNTDPVGKDNQVPYKWLAADIKAAHANNVRHIFAFGHKPAYSSPLTPQGGLDAAATLPQRDSLWKYLEDNNCEAMFSAHEHLWDTIHPHAGKTWQVIAGNGGSRVEPTWAGPGRQYYGYTLVNLYNDRKVNVVGVGRNTIQSTTAGGTPFPINEDENPSTIRNNFYICITTSSNTTVTAHNSYLWNGDTYTTSGTFTKVLANAAGCDSIATLILTIIKENRLPQVAFITPAVPRTIVANSTLPITGAASDSDGVVTVVELLVNGAVYKSDSTAPYDFTTSNIPEGSYSIQLRAKDDSSATSLSDSLLITVTGCQGSGSITAEGFTNITGVQVSDLTSNASYPANPTIIATLPTMEYSNITDSYGGRLRGYFCAPVSGLYRFYIAGDDQAGLWLSNDESAQNKTLIAYTASPSGFRNFNTFASQQSALIPLVKGGRYYIETLQKEDVGPDYLTVGVTLPDGTTETAVSGSHLSPIPAAPGVAVQNGADAFASAMAAHTDLNAGGLFITATPNPSTTQFVLKTTSASNAQISVRVLDVQGRLVENHLGGNANGTLYIGQRLVPGLYFVEVQQGKDKKRLKLIKQ